MFNKDEIKLALTSTTWDESELEAIANVLSSSKLTMGKKCEDFEKLFAEKFGSKYSIMVNSGSSANLLMVFAMKLRNKHDFGDEVIVPALSWSTTFSPLQQAGYKLKFLDIDLKSLCIDDKAIEAAISKKTVAIFAANILGQTCDYKKLLEICKKYDLTLLEDNCESMGAVFDDKFSGNFGHMASFSTFYSHHISTIEGGIITTNDEVYYQYLLALRAHGWTRNLPIENIFEVKTNDPWDDLFRFVIPGFNVRPMEIQGATGITQLKKIDNFLEMRRKNAEVFVNLFSKIPGVIIQEGPANSSWFGFSIILQNPKQNRRELIDILTKKGVQTRPIVTGNFVLNPTINYYDYEVQGDLKNTNLAHNNGFFIGNHHFDITSEIQKIASVVENFN
jgi:CDP-6-deoxy-D-xylo-4-hexulose-3-dehydrase